MAEHVRKASIVDGELVRCSVSQIKTADASQDGGCLRRWYFQKHDHIEEPQSAAMAESTKGHTIAETYLTDGFLPAGNNTIERSFLAGRHLLPESGTVKVEHQFDGELVIAGVPFNGKLDMWLPDVHTDGFMTWVTVRDHKFLRTLEKAKTGDQMERDAQMVGYGAVAIALTAAPITHVDLGHINYQKEEPRPSPGARLVNRMVPIATIQSRLVQMTGTVEKMKAAAKEATAASVPGNFKACYAFGKKYACPHIERCAKLKGTPVSTGFTAEELALFGIAPQIAPVAAPPVSDLPRSPVVDSGTVSAHKRSFIIDESTIPDDVLKAQRAASAGVTSGPVNGAIVTDGPGWTETKCDAGHSVGKRPPGHSVASVACEQCRVEKAKAAGILPPDAPMSDPELAAACPACETEKKNFQHRPEECPKKDGAPKKRGRKKAESQAASTASETYKVGDLVTVEGQSHRVTEVGSFGVQVLAAPEPVFAAITVRDTFAMAAMPSAESLTFTGTFDPTLLATRAYAIADAMLKVRNEQ